MKVRDRELDKYFQVGPKRRVYSSLAQSVEHAAVNRSVVEKPVFFVYPSSLVEPNRLLRGLRKILQKCLRLGIALKTPLCYNIHSGQ